MLQNVKNYSHKTTLAQATEFTYVHYITSTTNRDYFPTQYKLTGSCSADIGVLYEDTAHL